MKLLKFGLLSQNFLRNIELPCQSIWVPFRTECARLLNLRETYHERDTGGDTRCPSNSTSLNAGTYTSRMVVLRVLAVLSAVSYATSGQHYIYALSTAGYAESRWQMAANNFQE